jgi:LAO/AO transport system kinase
MQRVVNYEELLERFHAGVEFALARSISLIENHTVGYEDFLHKLYPSARGIPRVGITGPPGAGKSTLVGRITRLLVDQGETIGVIAVDPTSPFTGGALLGDRIRMDDVGGLPGVFIRSMGTRGSLGGLSQATRDTALAMDAFGKDRVIIETVGVGQSELDIVGAADTTVVVLVPESGDGVQAMKAGLMEIADIFVINKADRDGAERILREIKAILELKPLGEKDWRIPVIATVARDNKGVDLLLSAIEEHEAYLLESGIGEHRRRQHAHDELKDLLERDIMALILNAEGIDKLLETSVEDILLRDSTPYREAKKIIEKLNFRR